MATAAQAHFVTEAMLARRYARIRAWAASASFPEIRRAKADSATDPILPLPPRPCEHPFLAPPRDEERR